MSDYVTLTHRNVCKDGFSLDNVADSGKISALSSDLKLIRVVLV